MYNTEIGSVRKSCPPTHLQKQLNLFLDDKGLICCQGCINNADLSDDCKTPILLPSRHEFTNLLIRRAHNQVFHDGIRETLNLIREKYWIVRRREEVKRILRKCITCERYEGKSFPVLRAPQLPRDRVGNQPPFAITGVDFPGPLYVKLDKNSNPEKVYVCLFICGVTRAVHLELTVDLTSEPSVLMFLQLSRATL